MRRNRVLFVAAILMQTIAAQVLSAEPTPLEIPETMEANEQIPISGVVTHEQWDFYSLGCLLFIKAPGSP